MRTREPTIIMIDQRERREVRRCVDTGWMMKLGPQSNGGRMGFLINGAGTTVRPYGEMHQNPIPGG